MLLITLALLSGQPATVAKIDDDDRVKCKKETVTGSLARSVRVCYTVKQWRQIAETSVAKATEIQERGLLSPSNGN